MRAVAAPSWQTRAMPWDPLPTGRASAPTPIGAALDRVAKGLGLSSAGALAKLFAGWPEIVGAEIAAHTRPLEVRGDILIVAVDDPAWATQIRSLEPLVVERIEARLDEATIQQLKVRVRPD